jgi:indolepyruvate ferredoxin oxidoreductase beta subunit
LEALRYVGSLHPQGRIVTSRKPFVNIPEYPDLEDVLAAIREMGEERAVIIDSESLAKEAGSVRSQNMVMLGAASPGLIVSEALLREHIRALFQPKGEKLVEMNLDAFSLGREAAGTARG